MVPVGVDRVVGSYAYMAPEAWRAKSSQKSDVYSLGVVLWELLTAGRPWQSEGFFNPGQIMYAVFNGTRPQLDDHLEPSSLVALARECWDELEVLRPTSDQVRLKLQRAMKRYEQLAAPTPSSAIAGAPQPMLPELIGGAAKHRRLLARCSLSSWGAQRHRRRSPLGRGGKTVFSQSATHVRTALDDEASPTAEMVSIQVCQDFLADSPSAAAAAVGQDASRASGAADYPFSATAPASSPGSMAESFMSFFSASAAPTGGTTTGAGAGVGADSAHDTAGAPHLLPRSLPLPRPLNEAAGEENLRA